MKEVSKNIMECCMDRNDYPEFFDINVGMDFHLETRPELFAEANNQRKVRIEITTFRGISCGAIHYYAKIEADGIHICSYEKGSAGKVRKIIHGGYLGEEYKNLPRKQKAIWDNPYEIEAGRILTQEEIDADPIRWKYYHAGDFTNAFETKEDAISKAKEIVKARFDVDWIVEVNDRT